METQVVRLSVLVEVMKDPKAYPVGELIHAVEACLMTCPGVVEATACEGEPSQDCPSDLPVVRHEIGTPKPAEGSFPGEIPVVRKRKESE
jgi:hypothetical protein